jgi:signal recognition particle subunit SRP54
MVLAELGQRINGALQNFAKKAMVGDDEIKELLNEVAKALLTADVSLPIVKKVQQQVRAEVQLAEGGSGLNLRKIIQQAVFNALRKMVDPGAKAYVPKKNATNVIMFVGLQGSGKTTSCTKYALYFQRKGFKTGLVCADTFRAGAYDQLRQNASKAGVRFYGSITETDPVQIAKDGVAELKREKYDLIIVDTSGRHMQEAALFEEMRQVELAVQPNDIVYVLDGTNGQGVLEQAASFKAKVRVGSVILTKMDCHAKGGGALSAVAATASPIVFVGTGEHFEDFESFSPQGFVSRMLGMGDMQGLVEQMKDANLLTANKELLTHMQEGTFTMRDLYEVLQNMTKMGSISKMLEMIPGMQGLAGMASGADTTRTFRGFIHMMDSMTPKELDDPKIKDSMSASRIARIARGSGHSIQEVAQLMMSFKKFEEMSKTMGKMNLKNMGGGGGLGGMGGMGGMPGLGGMGGMGGLGDMMGSLMGGGGRGRGGGMNSRQAQQQMAALAKAVDPNMLKQMGGLGGLQGLMKQMSQLKM